MSHARSLGQVPLSYTLFLFGLENWKSLKERERRNEAAEIIFRDQLQDMTV